MLRLQEDAVRAYATMLRVCGELEVIVAETGFEAACALARKREEPMPALAKALAMTGKAARTRLLYYEHLTWR
ncbi:hypothetical protein ACIPQA_31895 [Streptomyces sp. NPDC090109]|uniref:hypothetical protein n=1 Tax=Streptomyces sp. NPDC090109 TaxID=3365948 RepID=UPI00382F2F58